MAAETLPAGPRRVVAPPTERRDAWWVQPLLIVVALTAFGIYAFWAALQNANYYAAPYLSPFYSPCLSTTCAHVTLPLVGALPWIITPAFLVLWVPLLFRATCYYYRRSYFRGFFLSPPACAVPDANKASYVGETRFPYLLNNLHRYTFWLALIVLAFLAWDVILALQFKGPAGIYAVTGPEANRLAEAGGPVRFGIGVGTIVLLVNIVWLTLYSLSCHSCRHIAGGYLDVFSKHLVRYQLWRWTSVLNARHALYAWVSMFTVWFADVYVRLVALGVVPDLRVVF